MKTKILLVDDEADVGTLIRRLFRRQIQAGSYEFMFVQDGLQALAVLEQQPDMDVVLSDINMPGMDGLTLLSRLRAISPIIQTVMVTAYGDMTNIRTAMNRGAFDFITKPFNANDLVVTLEKTVQYVRQLRETAQLKAVDEMKTRFFTNITHELRTPLSLMLPPVEHLLETATLPPPQQQSLATVGRNARHLLRLINQLLDISKLEAGQMELVNEVGDLPGFVGQVVDLFRPSADMKQLALEYQTHLPPGHYVFDSGKWEKILYNLLANAIKFTPVGSITVSLTEVPGGIQLAVTDTGIGIAADQLPHIFNRFYQVNSGAARAYEGTGIGLSLVQEMVTRLGGRIQVESPVAQLAGHLGTRLVLAIPVERVTHPVEIPLPVKPSVFVEVPLTGRQHYPVRADESLTVADTPLVLVVEDNAELREFIVTELATTYRIRSAANGQEGWAVASAELPDIIISDLMMPVQAGPYMDGYALLEQVKTNAATDHIAVVLLTAMVERESQLRGLAYGADEYLTKPFHVGELHLRLRNLLHRQQKLREHYGRAFLQPDTQPPLETVENPFLRRLYRLIEDRLGDSSLSVEWVADQLAMSRKTLYVKVHALTQLSPNELIRQYRLRKGADLLRSGRNASETAYLVGFESVSYFTKIFREFYHQTPTAYVKGY